MLYLEQYRLFHLKRFFSYSLPYNTNLRQIHESFQNSSKEEVYVGTISRRNCLRIQISAETLFKTQYLFFTPASEAVKVSRRWTFQTRGSGRWLSIMRISAWQHGTCLGSSPRGLEDYVSVFYFHFASLTFL